MLNIKIINVGFGDCYFIEENHSLLVVDCGTSSKKSLGVKNFRKYVNTTIRPMIRNYQYREALISHFDKDHYSGFRTMAKENSQQDTDLFNKIYVPYIMIKKGERYVILETAIYLYFIYQNEASSGVLAENIIKQIVVLCNLVKNNNIEVVYTGKKIKFTEKYFDVIWPDIENRTTDELEQLLVSLHNFLKETGNPCKEETEEQSKTEPKKIEEQSKKKTEEQSQEETHEQCNEKINKNQKCFEELEILKDKIVENFKLWYECLDTEEYKKMNIIVEMHRKLIKSLDDLIDSNNDIVKKIRYAVPTEVKYYDIKNFIKASNDTSIVFHSDELLMTGDVSRQIVEGILYERFKKEYYYFKVPHHGTAPYFSHLLPRKVVYAMCPIGQNKEYKVSENYISHFHSGCTMICNNAENCCEFLQKRQSVWSCIYFNGICICNVSHVCGIGKNVTI